MATQDETEKEAKHSPQATKAVAKSVRDAVDGLCDDLDAWEKLNESPGGDVAFQVDDNEGNLSYLVIVRPIEPNSEDES